jgi:chromosome segregation ATPase
LACCCCFQDEITEMKRKLKIMNHQIDQLKEEISAKEAALIKEHLEHQRVDKEKEGLKSEMQKMKAAAEESKAQLESLENEERKLLKIISETDSERLRQKKELDQVGLCNVRLGGLLRLH